MFPNNTKHAVKKLAAGTMRMNRARNRVVILAIILTTWLITSFFSIGMSTIQSFQLQELRMTGTKAQAMLTAPTAEQLQTLNRLDYVKSVGLQARLGAADHLSGSPDQKEAPARLAWYDAAEWKDMRKPAIGGWKGTYPSAVDELAAPLHLLQQMGIDQPELGMSIPLNYTLAENGEIWRHTDTFKLSGWFEDYSRFGSGEGSSLLLSEAFMNKSGVSVEAARAASVSFATNKDTKALIEKLRQDLKPGQGQELNAVSDREYLGNDGLATLVGYGGIVLFVMLSGYLLIYNVMYISVAGDTRFYGLLKTIGVTRRQIRSMIRRQALRLALIGIPSGLLAGAATALGIVPLALSTFDLQTGASISFHPAIYAGAALFALITTMVGCVKPARVAGRIPPVEAAKYTGVAASSKVRGGSGTKLRRMALRNIFRVKSRALVVFFSLFLGLTTFLIINTLVLSMDPKHFVDEYIPHDFELIHESGRDKQAITPELLERIEATPGVRDVRTIYLAQAALDYDPRVFGKYMDQLASQFPGSPSAADIKSKPGMFVGNVIGIDPADFREANKKLPSPVSEERFERGEIALMDEFVPAAFKSGDRFSMKTGDTVKQTELEIGGIANFDGLVTFHSMAPNVYISQAALKRLVHDPNLYKLSFNAEMKDWPDIGERVKSLIAGNGELKLESKVEMIKFIKSAKLAFYILGGGLSLILALIGLLNFINIMVTGVLARKPELAVLESIGMTSRQIKRLLLLEGACYAFISILLVTSLGNFVAYGAFKLFSQEATYAVYTFPAIPLTLVVVLVAAVCLSAPVFAYRKVRRLPLAERLREAA